MHMFCAKRCVEGFPDRTRYATATNCDQIAMIDTGLRISFKMVDWGSVEMLCNQSLDE